ncbi:hypothetical protein [Paenibacillus sp. CGMCC 1.18879]|uniref:hypothetical protein n=1 Tax=Paenibacillus sp. CGMCC 1.18879 TaxID=2834466 RepID=UPI001CA9FCE8|nr:hypothetical protein [Paenibacillus sp. CGMCC 1.18879]MBY9082611.1 hypothetical protein [Paenibacillus sp. CGMCC 1.18879]
MTYLNELSRLLHGHWWYAALAAILGVGFLAVLGRAIYEVESKVWPPDRERPYVPTREFFESDHDYVAALNAWRAWHRRLDGWR